MADEDALIKATRNKGRSASVCFSTARCDRGGGDLLRASPPGTPPVVSGSRHARRPASRSQSARLTGGKSVRRRLPLTEVDALETPHPVKTGVSDPKLHENTSSGTSSPVAFRRKGSAKRVNSVYYSHNQRKSTAFLDIPQTQSNANSEVDENSYRLRSFSFTTKGLVNRGDSFRRRHNRSNSVFPTTSASAVLDQQNQERLEQIANKQTASNSTPTESSVITYNVSVIGATGVGKTSLISQFMTSECINPYDRDREGPTQQTVSIMLNGEESELCFHELRSSKSFHKKHMFDAFLVIYSVVDKSTFQQAEIELTKLQDSNMLHTRPAILVGNKIDLARSRSVSPQDGKCLACTFRVKYTEISVGINHNVDELLVGTLNQIRLKKQNVEQESSGHQWYKSRGVIRASMKARQMFTWIFGREDSKFKNCENLHTL